MSLFKMLFTLSGAAKWNFNWIKKLYGTTDTINFQKGGISLSNGTNFVSVIPETDIGYFSTDGITWDLVNLPISGQWLKGFYGDGTYVVIQQKDLTYAVVDSFTATTSATHSDKMSLFSDEFIYSTDGKVWHKGYFPSKINAIALCWGAGAWAVLTASYSSGGNNCVWVNSTDVTDKTKWTVKAVPNAAITPARYLTDIAFIPNFYNNADKFAIISRQNPEVAISSDAATWTVAVTNVTAAGNNWVKMLTFKGGLYRFTSGGGGIELFKWNAVTSKLDLTSLSTPSATCTFNLANDAVKNDNVLIVKMKSAAGAYILIYNTTGGNTAADWKLFSKTNLLGASGTNISDPKLPVSPAVIDKIGYIAISNSRFAVYNATSATRCYSDDVTDTTILVDPLLESAPDSIKPAVSKSHTGFANNKFVTVRDLAVNFFVSNAAGATWVSTTDSVLPSAVFLSLLQYKSTFEAILIIPKATTDIYAHTGAGWSAKNISTTPVEIQTASTYSANIMLGITGGSVMVSTDYTIKTAIPTWTTVAITGVTTWYCSSTDGTEFILSSNAGTKVLSAAGVVTATSANTFKKIASSGGYYLGIDKTTNKIFKSTDGSTWASLSDGPLLSTDEVVDFKYINNTFMIIKSLTDVSYQSPDGLLWDTEALPSNEYWGTVGYTYATASVKSIAVTGSNNSAYAALTTNL